MPRFTGPIVRRDTSLGIHVRALWECLTYLIDETSLGPSEKRVRLRTCRAMLERAYKGELDVNAVQLDQYLAEEDGIPVEDAP